MKSRRREEIKKTSSTSFGVSFYAWFAFGLVFSIKNKKTRMKRRRRCAAGLLHSYTYPDSVETDDPERACLAAQDTLSDIFKSTLFLLKRRPAGKKRIIEPSFFDHISYKIGRRRRCARK